MSPNINIIGLYTNYIFWLLSSDTTFGALGSPKLLKIYNIFPPFNHSMLEYNLFSTCLYNWFVQNKFASIFSTFLNFSKSGCLWRNFDINMEFSDHKTNVFVTKTVIEVEKSNEVDVL